jgi:putative oxidoreductase
MNIAYTLGRIFIPIVFLASGIQKVMNVGETAQMLAANGVPIPDEIVPYLSYLGGVPKYEALGYLIAAIEVICGLMVLIGLKARWAALVLIVFTACTIVFVHHFWDMQGAELIQNRADALKSLSILGGLLLIVAVGAGPSAVQDR